MLQKVRFLYQIREFRQVPIFSIQDANRILFRLQHFSLEKKVAKVKNHVFQQKCTFQHKINILSFLLLFLPRPDNAPKFSIPCLPTTLSLSRPTPEKKTRLLGKKSFFVRKSRMQPGIVFFRENYEKSSKSANNLEKE